MRREAVTSDAEAQLVRRRPVLLRGLPDEGRRVVGADHPQHLPCGDAVGGQVVDKLEDVGSLLLLVLVEAGVEQLLLFFPQELVLGGKGAAHLQVRPHEEVPKALREGHLKDTDLDSAVFLHITSIVTGTNSITRVCCRLATSSKG